jgi:hypothetical protein
VTEAEIIAEVVKLLRHHYPYVLDFLASSIPSASEILKGPSAAEDKLRELQRLEGTED